MLTAATSGNGDYSHLLRDNYETPFYTPELGGNEFELQQLGNLLKLSVDDFKSHALTLSSPDELSVYITRRLMREVAPSLLWITMHDIDIAHAGAYSLYVDGIRRTDRLCSELWKAIQSEPEYAGNTTMLILPDFGRDADDDAGGNGFQHHRTGDALSRTTWMLAMGAGVREGVIYDRPMDSTDLSADDRIDARIPGDAHRRENRFRNCCDDAARRTQIGAVQQLPAGSAEARRALHRHAAHSCRLVLCRACCARLLSTTTNSRSSEKPSRRNCETLTALSPSDRAEWFEGFAQIKLSQQLVNYDWVNSPGQFVEQLSAHLVGDPSA